MTTAPTMPTAPATALTAFAASTLPPMQETGTDRSGEERVWQQVLARDRTADGSFVYAVGSTGIFCRPSCPSRRPDRRHVRFFRSVVEARTAGFRACLRCRPESERAVEAARDQAIVAAAAEYLRRQAEQRVLLADLCAAVGATRSAVLRAFRRSLGTTPARFARERRLANFRAALTPGARSGETAPRVTDAIYDAGFGSSSRLYESSAETLGMTPSALRRGAAAERICYVLAESPLGRTAVAATERGVCAIAFADEDETLRAELRGRFPKAELVPVALPVPRAAQETDSPEDELRSIGGARAPGADSNGAAVATWLAAAVDFVLRETGESPAAAAFPLDVRATAFQQRVWQALRQIPRGERRSYGAVARQLGLPGGARAVAGACARNPVALATPCHRVVGGAGELAGYRWGVARKQRLLEMERAGQEKASAGAAPTRMAQPG